MLNNKFLVLSLIVLLSIGIYSFSTMNAPKVSEEQPEEPNYYGLALMGLVPANQEDAHEPWNGDVDTGVSARDQQGNEYHLIKDAFGRTFLR